MAKTHRVDLDMMCYDCVAPMFDFSGSSSNLVGQFFDKYSISRWPC